MAIVGIGELSLSVARGVYPGSFAVLAFRLVSVNVDIHSCAKAIDAFAIAVQCQEREFATAFIAGDERFGSSARHP
jgi:hypothetical protein